MAQHRFYEEPEVDESEPYPLATADDVDLELPNNLLNKEECVLCGVKFGKPNMYQSHVEGLKHQGKKAVWMKKQYEAMGINANGWLVNPVTWQQKERKHQKLKRHAKENPMPVEDVYKPEMGYREDKVPKNVSKAIGCPQCRVFFEKAEDRLLHKQTPHHAMVIWELSKGHVRPGTSISILASAHKYKDYTCTACNKTLKNAFAFESHLAGAHHQKLANRIKQHGDVTVPKESYVPLSKQEKKKARDERKLGINLKATEEINKSIAQGPPKTKKAKDIGPSAMIQHQKNFEDCVPAKKPKPSFGLQGPSFNLGNMGQVQMTGMFDFSTPSAGAGPSNQIVQPPPRSGNRPSFGAMDFLDQV